MQTKTGYVTIIGKPNVGKSTLMNALLGEKISIATSKPQTTRKRVLGILSDENHQIIFLDTPGILSPKYLLQEKMMDHVTKSVHDADVLVCMIDIKDDPHGVKTLEDETVAKLLEKSSAKKILIINKIDKVKPDEVKELALAIKEKQIFADILGVSAITHFNVDLVKDIIQSHLPEHPKYYPDDQITDETERFFVSEIVREKILEQYRDEVPYSTEVVIEEFKERKKGKDYILVSIIIEKESQKPILIGKKGEAIKNLGELARNAIDRFLGRPVYLELRVKVKGQWRSDKHMLRQFGYDIENE
ncbi:MAG: GTPase Era [Melioribacteraceae bacterium]|nr:GTPase Era [Melioribacteraceae bacterium]